MGSMTVKVHSILGIRKILGKGEIEVSVPKGCTVGDLLMKIADLGGDELRSILFNPGSTLPRSYIRLMVNGRDIGFLQGIGTVLQQSDELLIMEPAAGG